MPVDEPSTLSNVLNEGGWFDKRGLGDATHNRRLVARGVSASKLGRNELEHVSRAI